MIRVRAFMMPPVGVTSEVEIRIEHADLGYAVDGQSIAFRDLPDRLRRWRVVDAVRPGPVRRDVRVDPRHLRSAVAGNDIAAGRRPFRRGGQREAVDEASFDEKAWHFRHLLPLCDGARMPRRGTTPHRGRVPIFARRAPYFGIRRCVWAAATAASRLFTSSFARTALT